MKLGIMSKEEQRKAVEIKKHIKEDLHDLKHLLEAGEIDEEEYDKRRHRLRSMHGNSAAPHE